jgi:serine protease AprX
MTRGSQHMDRRRDRRRTAAWPLAVLAALVMIVPSVGGSGLPFDRFGALRLEGAFGAVGAERVPAGQGAAAASSPWWERSALDQDRDGMFDALDRLVDAGSRGPVDVIVDLDHAPTDAEGAALAALARAPGWGVFPSLQVVGLREVPAWLLPTLARAPGVVMLESRVEAVPFMDVATPAIKARESTVYGTQVAWELGVTGKDVNIAIMDTGVDDAHPALRGKFVAGADFTKRDGPILGIRYTRDGTFNPDDQAGHGTTCAGIATSTGAPDGTYVGAAPDARLLDLRIGTPVGFSPGEGPNNFYDAALQAIDWAAAHADTDWPSGPAGIDVISLSWGIPYDGPSDGSDAYSRGLDTCVERGIQVTNAAGNDGPSNSGLTGMSASGLSTIVAALDDLNTIPRDDDIIASYSSRGPRDDNGDGYPYDELKPDVSAPGTNINGVVFDRTGDASNGGYGSRGSGTSYACPYVAGVSALLIEANRDITPLVIREVLRATAERRGEPEYPDLDPYWSREFGWGMVDAYNATLVVLEIEDLGSIDVELQAFATGVTGGTREDPIVQVDGIAWARVGSVHGVEWRVDAGEWEATSLGDDGTWQVRLGPHELGSGEHAFEARAVGDDGSVSVWRPVGLNVSLEAVEPAAGGGGGWGWWAAGAAVVAVAAVYVWKGRPDLLDRALRMMHIRHAPAAAAA